MLVFGINSSPIPSIIAHALHKALTYLEYSAVSASNLYNLPENLAGVSASILLFKEVFPPAAFSIASTTLSFSVPNKLGNIFTFPGHIESIEGFDKIVLFTTLPPPGTNSSTY